MYIRGFFFSMTRLRFLWFRAESATDILPIGESDENQNPTVEESRSGQVEASHDDGDAEICCQIAGEKSGAALSEPGRQHVGEPKGEEGLTAGDRVEPKKAHRVAVGPGRGRPGSPFFRSYSTNAFSALTSPYVCGE